MKISKCCLIEESHEMMNYIYHEISKLPTLNLNQLCPLETMLVIIDMNNGFAKKGSLYSPRAEALIKPIEKLTKEALNRGILTIAFTDAHSPCSPEFDTFPLHCVAGSEESQIVDQLQLPGIIVIGKNSTNAFLEPNFYIPPQVCNVIVVGVDTDICVYQFAVTLKAYFNQINKKSYIYVPMNAVDTYNSPQHQANFINYVFFNSMLENGIDVVKKIVTSSGETE